MLPKTAVRVKAEMKRFSIIRYAAFIAELILCSVMQSIPQLSPEVFGGRPVLLIPAVMTTAIFMDEVPAVILAAAGGLLADSVYSGPMGYYGIMLAVYGYIVSVLMENYIRTNLLTAMLAAVIGIPVIISGYFLFFYIAQGYSYAGNYYLSHILPEIIYTLVLVPVFYWINHWIAVRTMNR